MIIFLYIFVIFFLIIAVPYKIIIICYRKLSDPKDLNINIYKETVCCGSFSRRILKTILVPLSFSTTCMLVPLATDGSWAHEKYSYKTFTYWKCLQMTNEKISTRKPRRHLLLSAHCAVKLKSTYVSTFVLTYYTSQLISEWRFFTSNHFLMKTARQKIHRSKELQCQ